MSLAKWTKKYNASHSQIPFGKIFVSEEINGIFISSALWIEDFTPTVVSFAGAREQDAFDQASQFFRDKFGKDIVIKQN